MKRFTAVLTAVASALAIACSSAAGHSSGWTVTQSITGGQTLSGTVSWDVAMVHRPKHVLQVAFYVNGVTYAVDTAAPYGASLDTTGFPDGNYSFRVEATDRRDGHRVSDLDVATIDNVADPPPPNPQCSNGTDDDGDSLIDYPADPGCTGTEDTTEAPNPPPPPPAPECSDAVDNDGDSLIDFPADPGCTEAADTTEAPNPPDPPPAPQCSNGVDDDFDGAVDFPIDPGCSSETDETEAPNPPVPPPGEVINVTTPWTCTTPNRTIALLKVTLPAAPLTTNAVTIRETCDNLVVHQIEVDAANGSDGVKIGPDSANGVNNVRINGGYVKAYYAGSVANHTDGMQAGGGVDITFTDVVFLTGQSEGGNAAFFTSGWAAGNPTRVVCNHCAMGQYSATQRVARSLHVGTPSWQSGARDSRICQQRYFAATIDPGVAAVNENNQMVMHSNPEYWNLCSQAALFAYVGQ